VSEQFDLDLVLAPNPSPLTGRGTNTYVLGHDDAVAIIDPGPDGGGHLERVEAALAARGRAAVILLTHHHVDHSAGARALADRLHAPLAGIPHRRMPPLDRQLADGDTLTLGNDALTVVATPGHCRDHACFQWRSTGAVFAGDLVAGEGFIVIDPPDGNMTQYLASLHRVANLQPTVVLPGHGPEIAAPADYLRSYIAHRLEREQKVLDALSSTAWRRAPRILLSAYSDTPKLMYPIAARSLRAHLDKLVSEGRVERSVRGYRRAGGAQTSSQ
jgi:glyoxylase-like metal-dependent hydrolase (beta-lactamase superfamily II)